VFGFEKDEMAGETNRAIAMELTDKNTIHIQVTATWGWGLPG